MAGEGLGRAGCAGAMLLAIVGLAGGFAWLLGSVVGGGRDPWREADGALAVSLLASLGEEYHVLQQVESVTTTWALARGRQPAEPLPPRPDPARMADLRKRRFESHLARARQAAGPRVLALAILGPARHGGTGPILIDGDLQGYSVSLAPRDGAGGDIQVGRGELRDGRPVLLLTKPLRDQWDGGRTLLPWTAHVFLDPDAPPAPAAASPRDERGVLADALLSALAAEYHGLTITERERTGLARVERQEQDDKPVDPEQRQVSALEYVKSKELLDQRFQSHLAAARAAAGTRCLGLVVESADPAKPGRVLEAAGAGRFNADERFAIERNGRPIGIGVGLGSFGGKPALETRSSVPDAWAGKGELPWSAHVWLNADPRQAPAR